jgi:hypothetical protein
MKCWYDGLIQLRKGDKVRITKGYDTSQEDYDTGVIYDLRVTVFDVLTTGAHQISPMEGKADVLSEPIIGIVIRSSVRSSMNGVGTTFFEIEEGYFEDHVFIKAGEVKKGQAALTEILSRRIDEYVKILDPYISADTIKLLSNVGNSKDILILTENISKIDAVKKEANNLPNRLVIKKGFKLHDRFILTKGEGWIVGHSLKDFGTRTSQLTKMASSLEAETAFDENWSQSGKTVFEKK